MLSEMHGNVQLIFKFGAVTGLANDTAQFEKHDRLVLLPRMACALSQPREDPVRIYLQYSSVEPLAASRPRSCWRADLLLFSLGLSTKRFI